MQKLDLPLRGGSRGLLLLLARPLKPAVEGPRVSVLGPGLVLPPGLAGLEGLPGLLVLGDGLGAHGTSGDDGLGHVLGLLVLGDAAIWKGKEIQSTLRVIFSHNLGFILNNSAK